MHRTAPPLALHPLVLLSTWTLVHPASRHLLMLIVQVPLEREREKFNIRQAPIGGKDDYDSENSCISNGLPSSSRRGRGESGERSGVQARSDGAKSEINVERSCDPGGSAEDFAESVIEITVVGIVFIWKDRGLTVFTLATPVCFARVLSIN